MKRYLLMITCLILGLAVFAYAAWDGATNYPGALDDDASLYDVGDDSTIEPEHHDALAQACIAIETKIGTGASTPADNQVLTGTGAGTSAWGAVDVSTDVTGVLNVENGGTEVAAITDHCVMLGSGTAAISVVAVGATKEVLKGVTGADPVFATERVFSVLDKALADETNTDITEAQILANKYITNQGSTSEADLVMPDIEYYATVVFIVNEALIIEINPPNADAHEAFDLDGTVLDASDCIDSPVGIGAKIAATRMQIADGTWKWSFDTIRGAWTDTGASD